MDAEFGDFARAAWPRLVRAAIFLGAPRSDAEDLAQSALVKCYSRWKKIGRLADDPHAYTYKALLNEHRKAARKWQETPMGTPPDTVTEATEASELASAVLAAVRSLPPPQRDVIVCRFLLDLSETVTAQLLDVPAGTIKSRQSRALRALAASPDLSDEAVEGTS